MSSSSYRLQAPRARQPPPSLHFEQGTLGTSTILNSQNTQTLLYDLPSTTSLSPPTSPTLNGRLISPTSPSFPGRPRATRNGRPTPPPTTRNRSTTPLGVAPSELEKFAEYCRAWYFNQDDESGRLMTQTLATLPASQRAPFSRLQASIRSAYHRSVNARKTAEFQAHLTATQLGGSLMPHSRANPRGKVATKERYERTERFIRNWCTMGMPGTQPFFEALWAVMRLQVLPENLGGAGGNRIEWKFDDAVFKEAAGKDFMMEAIDVLKGVLAFEETPCSGTSGSANSYKSYPAPSTTRPSQPPQPERPPPANKAKNQNRSRASSDPFLDTPALSRSAGSSSSQSSGNTTALLASLSTEVAEEPPSPGSAFGEDHNASSQVDVDDSEEQFRIWTSPDLSNPEYLELLKLFPTFVSRRPLPRFPTASASQQGDIEEGDDDGVEGKEIRFGTGSMYISSKQRSDGWQGGWWTRFMLWWRRLFC